MATDHSKPAAAAAAGSGATGPGAGGRVASAAVEELIINRWSPRTLHVMCGFAAARIGPRAALPDELREREQPNGRKPIGDIAHRGILGTD